MRFPALLAALFITGLANAQTGHEKQWWHGKERTLRYHPEGQDIVITNGNRRFTRALYGTNTAFRVEAGDLPEFALYMPGMGGNIKFGLHIGNASKWLIDADSITARYRAGSMLYTIHDKLLGKGELHIIVLAMAGREGVIIKLGAENIPSKVLVSCVYGGATGKKFSRDGDMGPDPESSFYLKPEYCFDDHYTITKNRFLLRYGTGEILSEEDRYENKNLPGEKVHPVKNKEQIIYGLFPVQVAVKTVDAARQSSPYVLLASEASSTPAVMGQMEFKDHDSAFFSFMVPGSTVSLRYADLPLAFEAAETARRHIAERISVNTPDPFINTIGGALSIAADAIWEEPSYLHGAIGWRSRLNGWRGAYAGDVLGWHDRARMHFRSYARSQVTSPGSGKIIADTALHLARQLEKMGTSVFSSGYISRSPNDNTKPHHYDMNLVYIDELLWHLKWTGDTAFCKEIWPVIKRHLAWEKRNFDANDDGLYDAYAAIWASDGLQYSGGAGTHTSAYNFKANKLAAELAILLGEDPTPYSKEAAKIEAAVNNSLWMKDKGWYAEFKDTMGLKLLHPAAALWTIYHAIDGELSDAFKAYQSLQYIDNNIPHIPVKAKGLTGNYYTLSTTNWMPYTWSLNNVVLAELMHTSLANWESGRNEEAFKLWKSALLESMYLGGSPGNFQQISTYDAIRGEAYRDFGDPIGMAARSLVQGLFGISPDALHDQIVIAPGFPRAWKHASIKTPDIDMVYKLDKHTETYTIVPSFHKKMKLFLLLKARTISVASILVNGKKIRWENIDTAVAAPMIRIYAGVAGKYRIVIKWTGTAPVKPLLRQSFVAGESVKIGFTNTTMEAVYDPQQLLEEGKIQNNHLSGVICSFAGIKTAFVKIKQGQFRWWQPITINAKPPVEIIAEGPQDKNGIRFSLINNTRHAFTGSVMINSDFFSAEKSLPLSSREYLVRNATLLPGSNQVEYAFYPLVNEKQAMVSRYAPKVASVNITNWHIEMPALGNADNIDLSSYFNDKVTNIFRNQYLSPRPNTPTLQLPTQGIGEWTHPMLTAAINDAGFRKMAANGNNFRLMPGIGFRTPADERQQNILFTSRWDNYPAQIKVKLSGKASHAYLLMAGSTNTMQSRMTNGRVIVMYADNSSDTLALNNPGNWWPIEQDYYNDGYAFATGGPQPIRIHLKTGRIIPSDGTEADSFSGKMIDGGAATVLDMVLNRSRELKELKLETITNDVVIGLMAVTLIR